MTKDQMRDILLSDFARWQDREAAQAVKNSRASLGSYAEDQVALRGLGMVTSREVRVSPRWQPTRRSATDRLIDSAVICTYADGSRVVKQRVTKTKKLRPVGTSKTPTVVSTRITAKDLPAIGNIE